MNKDPIVIVGSARTPMGGMNGGLSGMSAPELGSTAIKGAIQQSGVNMHEVEDVVMGCAQQQGSQAINIGRLSGLAAGLPDNVPA